jgi:tetratricopeptide (TPR) repeat protein
MNLVPTRNRTTRSLVPERRFDQIMPHVSGSNQGRKRHMLKDRYGNSVSTSNAAALAHYDEALELISLYRGDPVAALDRAIGEDAGFGSAWAARAGLLAQLTDRALLEEANRSIAAGSAASLTEADRMHLVAVRDWHDGRFHDSTTRYARIARENPRDLVAQQYAHLGCFFLGLQFELRDAPLQALRAFSRGDTGYGPLLGMAAFGLEECGDFARAQALGEEAVLIDPRDGWAVHAVAHVHEMRGDLDHGIPWLADSARHWAPESGFAFHNWWHLALLHLDRGDTAQVLRLYDECIRPNPEADVILEWLDASAILWRLRLEGVDTGDRFARLASCWERAAEQGIYAFNDLHAVMAFIGAGRINDAERTIRTMREVACRNDDNGAMTREVGLPLAEAFLDFDAGRYQGAAEKILKVRSIAQRFGGSHAQRDIITLTAIHAALRGGMRSLSQALASERVQQKPRSPWAGRLARQASAMKTA